jgi:trehalose 6-phosphate synthase
VHEGLLANDVVGFHTERWRRAFLLAVERLLDAQVDIESGTVEHRSHTTRVVARPIGVDPSEFERLREDPVVREREGALAARRPELLVLRVDRIDPSKNIVRGFQAFALLLERHPELHGKVGMAALLAPSRQDIPEYADYAAAVDMAAQEVNDRFGRDGWTPVDLDVADDFLRSIAGYKQFDVLLANPVFDGLNLVAKEAFLVNERDGALVLSENAGVHEELGEWAITVNPLDVSGQADALYAALTLAPYERRRRADAIRDHVRRHGISEWIDAQLADLDAVRSR